MSRRTQDIHAELRSASAGPKTGDGWRKIVEVARSAARDEALAAQLEEEVWPAVVSALDRAWPAELRVVSPLDPLLLRRLGKTLRLVIGRESTRELGATLGLKLAVALNKKTIRELAPRWLEGARWEGLILVFVEREHEALVEGLHAAGLVGLRHLHIDDVSAPQAGGLRAMVSRAIDLWGATLESYRATQHGGDAAQERFLDHAYGPLIERSGELSALRHLWAPWVYGGATDPLLEFLAQPGFDRLEALSLFELPTAARRAALVERAASRNLRRLRVGLAQDEAAIQALMAVPNLAGVEVWDVRAGPLWGEDGWEGPDARLRSAQRAGRLSAAHELDAAEVDLTRLTAAQAREVLCEGARLRPSARLETLRIKALDDACHALIAAQAHEAWPALRALYVADKIADVARFEAWRRSPSAPKLRVFEWASGDDWVYHRVARSADAQTPIAQRRTQRRAALRALVAQSLEASMPAALAHQLLRSALTAARDKPERAQVAKCLGVVDTTGSALELGARCHEMMRRLKPPPDEEV